MEEFELSPEDAEFYLDNKELVDISYGSSLRERIDEAHMYLNGSGEFEEFDEDEDEDEDDEYWNDEY